MNKQAGLDLISIIRDVLHHTNAKRYDDYHDIYKLARFHHVEGISFLGIKDYKDIDLYETWKKEYDKTVLRNTYFDIERQDLLYKMKENGLSYMPLKGINLLPYYNDLGMRFMADNDILYGYVNNHILDTGLEKEAQDIMVSIMKDKGYNVYSLKGKDDVFTKKPFYNFEMHRSLVEKGNIHYDYYSQPFLKAVKDKYDENMYHFTLNDEYIYIFMHAYKHMEYSGIGIRYLIDAYVFLNKNKDHLDFDYIYKEIDQLNITDFYNKSYKLCMNAFEYEMDDEDIEFLALLLSCGTYGTDKQQFENRIKDKSKLKYLMSRIFVDTPSYQQQYPIFFKYPILKLILPFYRITLAIIHSPKRIIEEIKLLIRK